MTRQTAARHAPVQLLRGNLVPAGGVISQRVAKSRKESQRVIGV